jgi:hypothetical protein
VVVFGLLPVLCSEREGPFFVPSPAIRFPERAEATGGATGLQMLMTTGPTTVSGSGTYVGTLSLVPEPSSLALLAPAALFVFYRRRRRAIAGLPRLRARC